MIEFSEKEASFLESIRAEIKTEYSEVDTKELTNSTMMFEESLEGKPISDTDLEMAMLIPGILNKITGNADEES
ncbi:MAG: hypothetical protein ACK5MN_03370 [Lachnospiraceae bacterium]